MRPSLLIMTLLTVIVAAACAPATMPVATSDASAIRTSAAQTVVAEFTLTAAAVSPTAPSATPTLTPAVTSTAGTPSTAGTAGAGTGTVVVTDPTLIALGTPGALCDSMAFNPSTVDVTVPDGSALTAGQEFVKTWKIKNDGACAWGEGYGLIYSYGERMNGQPVPLSTVVEVGQEVEVSVNLKAPAAAGEYLSAWQMVNAKGVPFGKALFLKIIVQ